MSVAVRKISNFRDPYFKDFLNLPKIIYKQNTNWIAPLEREFKNKIDPKKNSFFKYGEVEHFIAYNSSKKPLGRVSVILNPYHNRIHEEKVGFFGHFESINDHNVAQTLLNKVEEINLRVGNEKVIGPVNLTTNDEFGFLLEGYQYQPTYMCNYCPSYYHELMYQNGYSKAIDTYSYLARHTHPFPEKYYRLIKRVENNPHIRLRTIDKKNIITDIKTICSIYNDSFHDTWGFVPITEAEAIEFGRSLLPIVDEKLIWLAYYDDEPVGVILGFPDINELISDLDGCLFPKGFYRFAFKQSSIKGMRVAALGIKKNFRNLGIETVLIHRVHNRVLERPYPRSEFSVVLENNLRMRNLLIHFGFKQCRRFRLYQKQLEWKS